jgi:hypothetical protein
VPARVVELSEAVDVDGHDRQRPALAARATKLDLEGVLEGAVVEHAGERIAKGERLELPARLLELLGDLLGLAVGARVATEHEAERHGGRHRDGDRTAAEDEDGADAGEREQRRGHPYHARGQRPARACEYCGLPHHSWLIGSAGTPLER